MGTLTNKQKVALNNWPRTDPGMAVSFPYLGNTGNGFGDLIDGITETDHNHGTTTIFDGSITDTSGVFDFADDWINTTGRGKFGMLCATSITEEPPDGSCMIMGYDPDVWAAGFIFCADFDTWELAPLVIEADTLFTNDIDCYSINCDLIDAIDLDAGTISCTSIAPAVLSMSGANLETDEVTGAKIGTSTAQLLGFYNAVPVDQPDTIVDADGSLADATIKINTIIDRLQELGLIA